MPYPKEPPTSKHDLVGPRVHSHHDDNGHEGGVLSSWNIPSTSKMFEQLEQGKIPHVTKLSSVYTYPDGPQVPGPLSRALIMIGFVDASLSVVRQLMSDDADVPPCFHKCTVGVKRADAEYASHIHEKDLANSHRFAKFMRMLRKEGAVAILASDKLERFGILRPMHHDGPSSSEYCATDFAAVCYVGNLKEVKAFWSAGGSTDQMESRTYQDHAAEKDPADQTNGELWQPPGTDQEHNADQDSGTALWQPPGTEDPSSGGIDFGSAGTGSDGFDSWQPSSMDHSNTAGQKRKRTDSEAGENTKDFHADSGAAAADAFYSGLTRSLETRADSRLYHMRAFNGWVKATQIQELNPKTKQKGKSKASAPLRVLDLACGKGGDLGKWVLHSRGIGNYIGIDVARGSLQDAALRARRMRNKLKRCTFTCADLGADVPGRLRSPKHKRLQELLSWSLHAESEYEAGPPQFQKVRGGGISAEDKFDVVSIQFAIHYMMSSKKRARRFFQTVSQLLEVGGNLIVTTIDARVVLERMMGLGLDLHFDNDDSEENGAGDSKKAMILAGGGACRIEFDREIVKRIFTSRSSDSANEDLFGLQYTFTLVEGSDHAAGVGDAVNLPEWLTPIPVLKSLASEAGLDLEYAQNFHEFYATRRDPAAFPIAHNALYNIKVLDRNGSVSKDEWDISRLYAALKFRKTRESKMVLDEENDEEEEDGDLDNTVNLQTTSASASAHPSEKEGPSPSAAMTDKLLPMAMMNAKKVIGGEQWQSLSGDEKKRLIQVELDKLKKK